MTEPAPPPSGGDPAGQAVRSPDAVDPGPSQWARPGSPADEGPSLAPESAPVAYAPPPVSPTGPQPAPPSGGGWGPTPSANPTWSAAPPAGPGWGAQPSAGPGWGAPPASGPGWSAPPVPGPGWNTPLPPPPQEPARPPKRVDHLPGTPFGVVHLDVPPVTSGLAVGSLVAGIASILVSLVVACFGIGGESVGGAWAAGAFTLPGVLAGAGAIVAGRLGLRQIRRPVPPPAVRFTGRGLALAGISCGAVGLVLSLLALGLALLLQFT